MSSLVQNTFLPANVCIGRTIGVKIEPSSWLSEGGKSTSILFKNNDSDNFLFGFVMKFRWSTNYEIPDFYFYSSFGLNIRRTDQTYWFPDEYYPAAFLGVLPFTGFLLVNQGIEIIKAHDEWLIKFYQFEDYKFGTETSQTVFVNVHPILVAVKGAQFFSQNFKIR